VELIIGAGLINRAITAPDLWAMTNRGGAQRRGSRLG
jgi:hypothetical protein